MRQEFGGAWTEAKLQALEDYLKAYMTIMRGNPGAQNFRTIYLDGFAGSGRRYAESGNSMQGFLEGFQEPDTLGFCKGSVRRALETVFCSVLKTPVILRNTRGILLYRLCFGVSNPRGRVPAIRIAQDIARKFNDGN